MNSELNGQIEPRDEFVTEALRALHAPPANPEYWSALEGRILARVAEGEVDGWWAIFHRWTRAGIAAAAIALLAGGYMAFDSDDAEAHVAYRVVLDDDTPTTMAERLARTPELSENEAVIRYVLPN
jgi:hypothetical protein